jgi:hypothetical protein
MGHSVSLPIQNQQQYSNGFVREVKHYKKWFPWLIPFFVVANVVVFVITMYVNNCPRNSVSCIARFLHRFSFQPLKENPLLGPSSLTLVFFSPSFFTISFYVFVIAYVEIPWKLINFFYKIISELNWV